MRHALLAALVAAVYLLHHDLWFWHRAEPIVFGVLPIGLAYHALYSIGAAAVMWLLVRYARPALSDVEGPAEGGR